jgi:hypothetical protein
MGISIEGMRHWCDSVEETFSPRLNDDIPRGEPQKQIPEAFLAGALRNLRATVDELEKHEERERLRKLTQANIDRMNHEDEVRDEISKSKGR